MRTLILWGPALFAVVIGVATSQDVQSSTHIMTTSSEVSLAVCGPREW